MLVGIQDELLRLHLAGWLKGLLVDKTSKANIIWATDAYQDRGPDYGRDRAIEARLITGDQSDVIKNRARKAMEHQSERTRKHAEVFTPLWVCQKMISVGDREILGQDPFLEGDAGLKAFFASDHAWQAYIKARRLEITCGEAPFLVQRYDVASGEMIPLAARQGLLDRKLRLVKLFTDNEQDWFTWTCRAFQATYGYEFQGDNLLIARLNLLMTLEDVLKDRWGRQPTGQEYRKIINIIAWNIWQMDGLTGGLPFAQDKNKDRQMDLFSFLEAASPSPATPPASCRIYNWSADYSLNYQDLTQGGKTMKFDFIIGNPPYQEETVEEISQDNGQAPRKNIFQHFQLEAEKVAKSSIVLIYPGGRWIHRSGKGMEKFGYEQINDVHLKKLIYYSNAEDVFPKPVNIADGISIVIKDMNKAQGGFQYVYHKGNEVLSVDMKNPGEELMALNPKDFIITEKVKAFVENNGLEYLHDRILPRSLFGIESDFVQKNPDRVIELTDSSDIDFDKSIKLFTNDKAGKAGRAKWYIAEKQVIQKNKNYISQWQVVVSSANAGGQKRDNQLEIIDNHSAFGRSRVALGSFETEEEAKNFFLYNRTYIVRFMFLMTDEALTSLGKRVPDLSNYTNNNNLVDFSKPLDLQLYSLIKLQSDDIEYIEKIVNNIRKIKRK